MVRLAPTRIAVDLSVSWAVTKTERDLRVFRLCVYRPYPHHKNRSLLIKTEHSKFIILQAYAYC